MITMQKAFEKLPPVKQRRIMDSALKTFAENGYEAASISIICKRSGISNGALYKYFKNKEAILFACVDYGIETMIKDYYLKYTNEANTLIDAVRNLLCGLKEFTRKHRDMVSIYSDLGSSSMNRFSRIVSEKIEHQGRSFFISLVENAKERGEIDASLRSDIAAYFIDTYITLYSYSLVSEHHARRFDGFFKNSTKRLTEDEKIGIIMESLRLLLTR